VLSSDWLRWHIPHSVALGDRLLNPTTTDTRKNFGCNFM
jgi:hypothetical protein